MALPKTHRLSGFEITEVIKRGKVFDSKFFRIKFFPIKPATPSPLNKFAIIISSRVSKKAVIRNKIKRKVGEAIRPLILKIRPGLVVIIVKPPAQAKGFDHLKEDLIRTLNKISQ